MRILIDVGHRNSKWDFGARGIGGVKESEIALNFSQRLGHYLRRLGVTTDFSRNTENITLTFSERLKGLVANPTAFISMHCNANTSSNANGAEVLYNPQNKYNKTIPLANAIQNVLVKQGMRNRGLKPRTNLQVLNRTLHLPAVLVELGFITNNADLQRLQNVRWIEDTANLMANSIYEALK